MDIRLTFKPFPRFPLQCDLLSSQHTGSKVCWRLNRMIRSSKKITLEWESALFGWFCWERPTDVCTRQKHLLNIFKPFNLPREKFTHLGGGGLWKFSLLLPNGTNYSGCALFDGHSEVVWVPVRICCGMIYKFVGLETYNFLTISPSEVQWILRNGDGQMTTFARRKTMPASSSHQPTLEGTAVICRNLDTSDKIWYGKACFRNFLWWLIPAPSGIAHH